jgi:hypothetical protein
MKPTNDPPDTILEEIHETWRRLLEEHGGLSGLAPSCAAKKQNLANRLVRQKLRLQQIGPPVAVLRSMERKSRPHTPTALHSIAQGKQAAPDAKRHPACQDQSQPVYLKGVAPKMPLPQYGADTPQKNFHPGSNTVLTRHV